MKLKKKTIKSFLIPNFPIPGFSRRSNSTNTFRRYLPAFGAPARAVQQGAHPAGVRRGALLRAGPLRAAAHRRGEGALGRSGWEPDACTVSYFFFTF